MSGYRFTPEASDDLFSIWAYIGSQNPEAANRVETAIYAACGFLAIHPQAGHKRQDLTTRPVRFWTIPRYRNYIVVYDPAASPLSILIILHAARDAGSILEP